MKPFIKWPGGKQDELKFIIPNVPESYNKYIEPFVGGGSVYLGIDGTERFFINDTSHELINLYNHIKMKDEGFFKCLQVILHNWNLLGTIVEKHKHEFIDLYRNYSDNLFDLTDVNNYIVNFIFVNRDEFNGLLDIDFNINLKYFRDYIEKTLLKKIKRMKDIEAKKKNVLEIGTLSDNDVINNIETAFKSAFYTHFRYIYNNSCKYNLKPCLEAAIFYFIREYCYSSMFRYNQHGEFNVPYGGLSYNKKSFEGKVTYLMDSNLIYRLNKTKIFSEDFESFFDKVNVQKDDFVFLDPPYDTAFSAYSNHKFEKSDHQRLANCLKNMNANFLMIIKNTQYISSLYKNYNIENFEKKYLVSFKNRNNKKAQHLLIKNY